MLRAVARGGEQFDLLPQRMGDGEAQALYLLLPGIHAGEGEKGLDPFAACGLRRVDRCDRKKSFSTKRIC
jgi:hypothetical protein